MAIKPTKATMLKAEDLTSGFVFFAHHTVAQLYHTLRVGILSRFGFIYLLRSGFPRTIYSTLFVPLIMLQRATASEKLLISALMSMNIFTYNEIIFDFLYFVFFSLFKL